MNLSLRFSLLFVLALANLNILLPQNLNKNENFQARRGIWGRTRIQSTTTPTEFSTKESQDLSMPFSGGLIWLQKNRNIIGIRSSANNQILNFTVRDYVAEDNNLNIKEANLPDFEIVTLKLSSIFECMEANCTEYIGFFDDTTAKALEMKWKSNVELCFEYKNSADSNVAWVSTFGECDNVPGQSKFSPSSKLQLLLLSSNGFGVMFSESNSAYLAKTGRICFAPKLTIGTGNEKFHSVKIFSNANLPSTFQDINEQCKFKFLSQVYPNFKSSNKVFEEYFKYSIWSYSSSNSAGSEFPDFVKSIRSIFDYKCLFEINHDWQKYNGDFLIEPNHMSMPFKEIFENGVKISIPVNPFINKFSTNFEKFKFMMSSFGNQDFVIDENVGGIFNLTRPAVYGWFKDKLVKLSHEFGIDSFRFGARKFGSFNENLMFRNIASSSQSDNQVSAYYHASSYDFQWSTSMEFSLFVQIEIKSNRNFAHNIKSLIPMALSMSMAGHLHIAPNLVVDNLETDKPSEEMYIRWVQAVTFMPVMKFTVSPWVYNQSVVELTRQFIELHAQHVSAVVKSEQKCSHPHCNFMELKQSIIKPLWQLFPDEVQTYSIEDQFMLGNEILVAPVLEEGQRERQVYFPSGVWIDVHHNGFTGPGIFKVQAPLDELPYFKLFEKHETCGHKCEL